LFRRTEIGLLLAIFTAIVLTTLIDSQHNYYSNPWGSAVDILRQTALLGIFTLGAAIVIIAGGIDLSSGSVIAFSGTVCASIMLLLAPNEVQRKSYAYSIGDKAMERLEQAAKDASDLDPDAADYLQRIKPLKDLAFDDRESFRHAVHEALNAPPAVETADKNEQDIMAVAAGFPKPIPIGVIAAGIVGTLVVGFLIGSLHAWLITVVQLPPFVATLATLVGLRSLGRAIVERVNLDVVNSHNTQIQIFDERFRYLSTSVWIPVLVFLVLSAVMWLLMSRTVVGRHLHALGGNEQAARLSGIRTERLKWLAYALAAMLSSIAGILYIGAESVANPESQGRGYELNAIASAVVGGCSLRGGVGTIPGAMLGALFLRVVVDGVAKVIKTGADVYEGLIVGIVVVAAVAFTQLRQAGRQGKQIFPGGLGIVSSVNLSVFIGLLAWLVSTASYGIGIGIGALAVLIAVLVRERLRDKGRKPD
jgi:ribose/xylose/arabinose/galactoside ABC-type transport system permease subunit